MIHMLLDTKSAKLHVIAGSGGAFFNSKFFYNKQLRCANIESNAEQV